MLDLFENANLLILSASKTFDARIRDLFQTAGCSGLNYVSSVYEAKKLLLDDDMDLLLLNAPLTDEDASTFALDLARSKTFDYSIILLANKALYETLNLYQMERMGIVIFRKPLDPHLLLQTMRLLLSMRMKIRALESKTDQLRQRMEDDRLVNRAKLILIESLKMSEADAHHFIEKKAMDDCVKKTKVAKDIINTYAPKP